MNRVGGEEAGDRLLRGELVVRESKMKDFPIWKTIVLGDGVIKDADGFIVDYKSNGIQVSDWAQNLARRVRISTEPREIDLVVPTVADLGFTEATCRDVVYERAFDLGLWTCPQETGLWLRRQYKDQPNGEYLYVCSEPILCSFGRLLVFHVRCGDSGLWLDSGYANPDALLNPGNQFVFRRPRK